MPTDAPQTTIRVRIKVAVWPDGTWVAVWPDGTWAAYGDNTPQMERAMDEILDAAPGGDNTHWVEATIPLPMTVEGEAA